MLQTAAASAVAAAAPTAFRVSPNLPGVTSSMQIMRGISAVPMERANGTAREPN